MKAKRTHWRVLVFIGILMLACGLLCTVSLAFSNLESAVDVESYAAFLDTEVLDVEDLVEGAEIQRRLFNTITPPGVELFQSMMPPVAPFDEVNFSTRFLDALLGEAKNSVAVYPLALILDSKTGDTLVLNAAGDVMARMPAENATRRAWPEGGDPSRVVLTLDLLPVEDVEPFLYVEQRVAESVGAMKRTGGGSGASPKRGTSDTELRISGITVLTNGVVQLSITNASEGVEVYAYTMWHESAEVTTVYTNEENVVVTNVSTVWNAISPSFHGMESAWTNLATDVVTTNGGGVYDDTGIPAGARVRFYTVANRQDSDGDGLSDGMELFVHKTTPNLFDTDGDGHSDGREVALGTDPLNAGDYFGIVINAALPIPPPPGTEVGREWVELFNAGLSVKSLAGFQLQTALPSGWTNVFTFPAGTVLNSGDFLVVGDGTNGNMAANLYMPNSSYVPPSVFGIRLVKPEPFHVADALFYGYVNDFDFSLDGFGPELPILRPLTNRVIRRTWVGFDSDRPGDWANVLYSQWPPHRQGEHLDLDGDGFSNAEELAGGLFPLDDGSRIDSVDSDNDGLSDFDEFYYGTHPYRVDTDGDAFPWSDSSPAIGSDADEIQAGTNPLEQDTDGDGIPDGWELAGGLNPLSPDSDNNAISDGDEDSDGDGITNAQEVANLTNPFDSDDVDSRPYIWRNEKGIAEDDCNEGDIGYLVTVTYDIQAQSNCPSIMVIVGEGGYMVEAYSAEASVGYLWLNADAPPPKRTRIYAIIPDGATRFTFSVSDGGTTWENETLPEYGADISVAHWPTELNIIADGPDELEESVGILLANKSAHPNALRHSFSINGPSGDMGYAGPITLMYDSEHLCVYANDQIIPSGTCFSNGPPPAMEVEGIASSSSMRDAWIFAQTAGIPISDRVTVTVLEADIQPVSPLANSSWHPTAARQALHLNQTHPGDWNGLMKLDLSGATAYAAATGGTAIASGSIFSNAFLPQTIFLEGAGCGTGSVDFTVVGRPDCTTNIPLHIFGVNATLSGVAEADEESPGGFIADKSTHTNAPRTALTLTACGPAGAAGTVALTWDNSKINVYASPTGGVALAVYTNAYASFSTATLYIEGIAPGETTLTWAYSGQPDCVDEIKVTVVRVEILDASFNPVSELKIAKWENAFNSGPMLKDNFIDLDPDRFYVRVTDVSKKGSGPVLIELSTDSPGTEYDDGPTDIELTEHPANSGMFVSTNMLLVADDVDDDFSNSTVPADNAINDRTHKVALGGNVQVLYATGALTLERDALVSPDIKTVDVNIVILRDKPEADGGVPVMSADTVSTMWNIAKERYAQVGVNICWGVPVVADPPTGVDLSDDLRVLDSIWATVLATEAKTLISALGTTNTTDDIHVFYVNRIGIGNGYAGGVAVADFYFDASEAPFTYNLFINYDSSLVWGGYAAAHELTHLTTNDGHPTVDTWRLMQGALLTTTGTTGSRRLTELEESIIRSNSHVK